MAASRRWRDVYDKYSFNVFRHLAFADRYVSEQLALKLSERGYRGVDGRLIQVLPYLGNEGIRVGDLATRQQLPKQMIGKLVEETVRLGHAAR